jgi:hypothetical protein
MRRNESAITRTISRAAVLRLARTQDWDPALYSAEIATAGVFCALAMLVIIAVL